MPAIRPRGRVVRAAAVAAGLVLAASGTAPAAPSSSRTGPALRASVSDRAAVEAARRFLCPHGGRPMRGRCRGGAATAAVAVGGGLSARDWDAGLPAAARRQAPCPEGTAQARVLFWDDAVRCVPR